MPKGEAGCLIGVRLKPSSSREKLISVDDKVVCVAVTAPPVDGKANEAMTRFLADKLDAAKSAVVVRRGQSSRNKIVEIAGMTKESVMRKLREALLYYT